MHDYSIDKNPKAKVLFYLAIFSIIIATGLQAFADFIVEHFKLHSNWSSIPIIAVPTFGVYIGCYLLFNNYLWKIKKIRGFLLVPDLNGSWECNGHTCLKDAETADIEWKGTVTISQSWSKLLIHLKTSQSESKSISASIYHEQGVGYRLLYQYDNKPNADQQDLKNHSGSSEMLFDEDITTADGSYFTDRHRTTVGTMNLQRMEA